MYGSEISNRRATITIAVATSATVMRPPAARSDRAARCAREEDDPVGCARDVLERADHLGLTAAGLGGQRNRRPHAQLELAAELLHQPLLVLSDLDVALGDQLFAVPRAHAQEPH